MKVFFENNRLQMYPINNEEEIFVSTLIRRMEDSSRLMGWWGDITVDGKETTGAIITWKPGEQAVGETPKKN